jgi:hypothetical protein
VDNFFYEVNRGGTIRTFTAEEGFELALKHARQMHSWGSLRVVIRRVTNNGQNRESQVIWDSEIDAVREDELAATAIVPGVRSRLSPLAGERLAAAV